MAITERPTGDGQGGSLGQRCWQMGGITDPEDKARQEIDWELKRSGPIVRDTDSFLLYINFKKEWCSYEGSSNSL